MNKNEKDFPKKGEIWLIDYTYNYDPNRLDDSDFEIETDIKKLRPSVIISNNLQNQFDKDIFVIPITSFDLEEIDEFFEILLLKDNVNNLTKDSKILIKSLRPINKKFRLKRYCGRVNSEILAKTEEVIKIIFDL